MLSARLAIYIYLPESEFASAFCMMYLFHGYVNSFSLESVQINYLALDEQERVLLNTEYV